MSKPTRAFICGCAGAALSADERAFIERYRPWGLILFRRNVENVQQITDLTYQFREIVGRPDAPVLIDQEGGRVQRMTAPVWPKYPSATAYGRLLKLSLEERLRLARLGARRMAEDLRPVGVTVDCLPVLDVPAPGSHNVIGDRAYSDDPALVARFGRAVAEGVMAGGVLPVMKHIPGHGRARADSHHELPVVDADRRSLEESDFAPFRALADLPMGMSAHVVYSAIDPKRPGTTSPVIVNDIIRGHIGFDGLLMTDDLSMKALGGTFAERTGAAFAAGVDVALHCNGDLREGIEVAGASPVLDGKRLERAERALGLLRRPVEPMDPVDALRRVESVLAMTA